MSFNVEMRECIKTMRCPYCEENLSAEYYSSGVKGVCYDCEFSTSATYDIVTTRIQIRLTG